MDYIEFNSISLNEMHNFVSPRQTREFYVLIIYVCSIVACVKHVRYGSVYEA